jgi:hypothetical protein
VRNTRTARPTPGRPEFHEVDLARLEFADRLALDERLDSKLGSRVADAQGLRLGTRRCGACQERGKYADAHKVLDRDVPSSQTKKRGPVVPTGLLRTRSSRRNSKPPSDRSTSRCKLYRWADRPLRQICSFLDQKLGSLVIRLGPVHTASIQVQSVANSLDRRGHVILRIRAETVESWSP